jgi:DNA repair exonuclease SbcCD ATPase subunit
MANGNNQDILNSLRELIDVLNKGVQDTQEKEKSKDERSQVLQDIDKTLNSILEKENELEDLQEAIVKLQKEENNLSVKGKKLLQEKLKELKKQQLELMKQNTLVGKLQKKYEDIKNSQLAQFASKTANAFKEVNRAMDAGVNSAANLAEKFGGLEQNVLSFETAKTQAKNIDQLSVSLNRTSGLSGDLSKTLVATQRELRSFGVTNQQTADTIQALGTGMSDFTRMDKTAREDSC